MRDGEENIVKRSDGRYEVGVLYVLGAELSNTNKITSRKRLENVERKLRRNEDQSQGWNW